jgi:2-dehydropantoate 2-reductase
MMLEILAIGRAMGFDEKALPSDVVDDTLKSTEEIHKGTDITHRPSMLHDLEYGRPMEVEAILGELARNAREYQVNAPVCQFHHLI